MSDILARFHRVLVEEIRATRPEYLKGPFTVAEVYQNLVPYGSHRDRIGVEMNGDYEDALLRLLAGEGDYLELDSPPALRELREEVESSNPNTGLYREFAAVDVRLNQARLSGLDVGVTYAGPPRAHDPGLDRPPTLSVGDLAPALEEHPDQGPVVDDDPSSAGTMVTDSEAAPPPATATEDASSCRWCRAELPERDNLNFCPFCGTDVKLVPCASCGEELAPEWRFCISCGSEAPA